MNTPTYPRVIYSLDRRYLQKLEVNKDYLFNGYLNKVAHEHTYEGNVSSGTINSFTDENAEWQVNELVDKVVKMFRNEEVDFCYALIKSNTSNRVTVDTDFIMIPCEQYSYKIIDSVVLTVSDLNKIIAIDNYNHDIGIVLPKVTTEIERRYLTIYIERSNNGNNNAVVIGRGTDYQLGAKYGILTYNGEGVTIYAHTWNSILDEDGNRYHWDIVNLQGIQRIGSGYWGQEEQITQETLSPIGEQLIIDTNRRFVKIIKDDIVRLRYTSLIERKFYAEFNCTIEKTGGAGEAVISIGVYNPDTDELIISERNSSTRFGAGIGFTSVSVKVPILLKRNYEIVALASTTGTAFFIKDGSTLDVYEV